MTQVARVGVMREKGLRQLGWLCFWAPGPGAGITHGGFEDAEGEEREVALQELWGL